MAKFKADFTDVGDGPGAKVPDGDYICKVKKISVEQGDKGKYLKWEFIIALGEEKGKIVTDNTSLLKQALFNLRNTIIACGIDVPKSSFNIDTDLYIGKVIGITVATREYTKDNVKKKASDVVDKWRAVKKGDKWVRAGEAVAPKAAAAAVDEEEGLTGGSVNGQTEEEVEEIEIE